MKEAAKSWDFRRTWLAAVRRGDSLRIVIGDREPDGSRALPRIVLVTNLERGKEIVKGLAALLGTGTPA